MESLLGIVGILAGCIIPVSVFVWLYYLEKDKNRTILELSQNLNDPGKVEELMAIFGEKKQEPLDYRRNGVVTMFTGLGLFLFGVFFLGSVLKGVGALVGAIGVGMVIAGYLYPNTSGEINQAVEDFEKK
tara:strand:- start:42 stop:431 length:390 start_codon:yes stop_codon:yes gene_type:complete